MDKLKAKLTVISPFLNERQRRIVFAAEAQQIGRGGKVLVGKLTGMSRPTLNSGLKDLQSGPENLSPGGIRRSGAGRKKQTELYPDMKGVLESLVEPLASGDSESA